MVKPFNDNWYFYKENKSEDKVLVTLPHDAMLHEARTPDAPGKSASGWFPGGVYYYEKEFDLTPDFKDKQLVLEFEGIYKNAEIYLNDELIKRGAYGYSPVFAELDKYARPGRNHIRVKADNSRQPDSRWYSGAGIYRPVSLHVLPSEHILIEGVSIRTIQIDNGARMLVTVEHTEGINKVAAEILDRGGNVVASGRLDKRGSASEGELFIEKAELWSAENPYLYSARIKAFADGSEEAVHEVTESFGIRMLSWSSKGFFVNGREVKLKGGCIHHDNGILGACADPFAEERRVRMLKEAGYNAIRSSHNPCSKAMLDACDKYGIYVMDELWDMWYKHKNKYDYATEFEKNYEEDIRLMIRRDRNHPSVIMYSIGNEVSEPASQKGVQLSVRMKEMIHTLDDSRPVTAGYNLMIISRSSSGKDMYDGDEGGLGQDTQKTQGMNSTLFNMMAMIVGTGMNKAANSKKADAATSPALDALDIAGYNYASGRYPLEAKAHPERIVFGSETFPQDIAKNWTMVEKYPYLIGDFMWTAWDYLGEAGLGTWSYHSDAKVFDKPYPWLISGSGAFDITGEPNGALFLAQAVWGAADHPVIAVQPCNHPGKKLIKSVWRGTNAMHSWAFRGCEGNKVVVEVFSNAERVELLLNGKSLGRKKIKNCAAVFKTRYEYGTITAVAYDASGRETGRDELRYQPSEISITAKPEKSEANVGDTVFIDVAVTGADGVVEANADERISVSVKGGTLLGFGSADPRTEESFITGSYTTYYGKALAAVRADAPGKLTVEFTGEGGRKAAAEIIVKE